MGGGFYWHFKGTFTLKYGSLPTCEEFPFISR